VAWGEIEAVPDHGGPYGATLLLWSVMADPSAAVGNSPSLPLGVDEDLLLVSR
jgi:hypothetical protein